MTEIIAYASSTRPNHLWSAAQFNSALPKNRTDADIPLVAQSDLNVFKGKYRALLKLVSKTRDKLVHVTDHIEDEGDRRYFGSTNDADDLLAIYHEMMSWIWDAVDETNRMKSDPYADIRKQRARAETAEAALAAKDAEIERLREALTPSGETKSAYIGEFQIRRGITDEHGDDRTEVIDVPWTTVKEIMAAISARAALNPEASNV